MRAIVTTTTICEYEVTPEQFERMKQGHIDVSSVDRLIRQETTSELSRTVVREFRDGEWKLIEA